MVDETILEDEIEAQGEAAPAKKKSKLPLILALLVVVGGGGAGGWFFLSAPSGEAEEAAAEEQHEEHKEPFYFTLADNLVVNFRAGSGARYLQVGIDLMTYDKDGAHTLEQHAPVLKSNLILLLSDQSQDSLLSREGKEALRTAALQEVRQTMTKLHGSPVVESIYFTSFVMQ
jgi:flagellar FliL protein